MLTSDDWLKVKWQVLDLVYVAHCYRTAATAFTIITVHSGQQKQVWHQLKPQIWPNNSNIIVSEMSSLLLPNFCKLKKEKKRKNTLRKDIRRTDWSSQHWRIGFYCISTNYDQYDQYISIYLFTAIVNLGYLTWWVCAIYIKECKLPAGKGTEHQ